MATVYIVEIVAIYEAPGAVVSNPRQNQINQDMSQADSIADRYAPGGVAPADEYLEALPPRYGAGWRCRRFVSVQLTAEQAGDAIATRLGSRNLQHYIVQVFPDFREDAGGTGAWLYKKSLPPQPDDTV